MNKEKKLSESKSKNACKNKFKKSIASLLTAGTILATSAFGSSTSDILNTAYQFSNVNAINSSLENADESKSVEEDFDVFLKYNENVKTDISSDGDIDKTLYSYFKNPGKTERLYSNNLVYPTFRNKASKDIISLEDLLNSDDTRVDGEIIFTKIYDSSGKNLIANLDSNELNLNDFSDLTGIYSYNVVLSYKEKTKNGEEIIKSSLKIPIEIDEKRSFKAHHSIEKKIFENDFGGLNFTEYGLEKVFDNYYAMSRPEIIKFLPKDAQKLYDRANYNIDEIKFLVGAYNEIAAKEGINSIKLDTKRVLALIATESDFFEGHISSTGDYGLMQIYSKTGFGEAKRISDLNPERNKFLKVTQQYFNKVLSKEDIEDPNAFKIPKNDSYVNLAMGIGLLGANVELAHNYKGINLESMDEEERGAFEHWSYNRHVGSIYDLIKKEGKEWMNSDELQLIEGKYKNHREDNFVTAYDTFKLIEDSYKENFGYSPF